MPRLEQGKIFFFRLNQLDEIEINQVVNRQARNSRIAIFCLKEEGNSIDITGYVPAGLSKKRLIRLGQEMATADLVVVKETVPLRIVIDSPSKEEVERRTYEATLDPYKELIYTWKAGTDACRKFIVSPYNYVFGNPVDREKNFRDLLEKVEGVDQIVVRDIIPEPK